MSPNTKLSFHLKTKFLDISFWPTAQSLQHCPKTPGDPRK